MFNELMSAIMKKKIYNQPVVETTSILSNMWLLDSVSNLVDNSGGDFIPD